MTPRQKAIDLVYKFTEHTTVMKLHFGWVDNIDSAKQCALIAVDQITDALDENMGGWDSKYWQDVKTEIEKL